MRENTQENVNTCVSASAIIKRVEEVLRLIRLK